MLLEKFGTRLSVAVAISLFALSHTIWPQDIAKNPDRGAKVGNAYSAGDFEVINTTNGNLMLNFPLGSLPGGRGAAGGGASLGYNSKIWDIKTEKVEETRLGPHPPFFDKSKLEASTTGGWRLNVAGITIEQEDRREQFGGNWPSCPNGTGDPWPTMSYVHKLRVVLPDGSKHEMLPTGYDDTPFLDDGYYRASPDGWLENCGGARSRTGHAMVYHSIDGSFLRVEYSYDNDSNPGNNTWVLHFPDGSRYESGNLYDRNGNYVTMNYDGVTDQLGRSVSVAHSGDYSYVTYEGFGGEDIVWTIKWKQIAISKTYASCEAPRCTDPHLRSTLQGPLRVVDRVIQPEVMGENREYVFHYNAPDYEGEQHDWEESEGWGEVSGIDLPSGAKVRYDYVMDGEDGPAQFLLTPQILKNYPHTKTVAYDLEYDDWDAQDPPESVETWTYNVESSISTVTGPDGSVTTDHFGATDGGPSSLPWDTGLSYKTVAPDGTKVEKIWAQNNPIGCTGTCPSHIAFNPYVKMEMTSVKDGSGAYVLTAIKDYAYDKNGNVTEIKEYDWVPYGDVPRTNGFPTGLPTAAASYLKRITVTEFQNPTPGASSTTYNDPDSYHLASSKRLLRLPKATETRDGSSSTKSRSEFAYDFTNYDSSNTKGGNVIATKVWDSTKGALASPDSNGSRLNSGNSVSTSATYNAYGRPLSSTDANGVVTQITYGNVTGPNGVVTDLYPTQTVAAHGTGLARTSTAVYDFHTGLVTSATDEDNDLTVVTEYDALGRPLKVRSAYGTALESWTQTIYDDVNRRIIVKGDLESVGDGRKVAIQHFDQLGRVRLSRTLENAAVEDPTNEQHGIKVQTRYLTTYTSPNGYNYQLTSNPYRAAISSAASSEPTMGWTRSKTHHLGKHSEVETFSGSALPAPWGSNTSSTGIVQTDIDANATTVTDQAGKLRRSVTNALGQLIRVDEPNASNQLGPITSPNQATYYHYNALGKMVRVQQGAQDRYFMYDSLGRMLRVRQPEQTVNAGLNTTGNPDNNNWTAGFTYDNNGNVLTATDAKGTTITNVYDALSRVTQRSYNDSPQTPTVNFYYDGAGLTSVPDFSKGKLTRVSSSVSESRYTEFDVAGRLLEYKQITDGQTYTSEYEYNLSGALVKETYPSGREVRNDFDPSGDIERIFGKANQSAGERTYANSFSYFADGRIEKLRLGNGLWESAKINSRGQVTEFKLGHGPTSGSLWKNNYEYGELQTNGTVDGTQNSGNIGKQTVTFNGLANPFVQTYQYDTLYRLTEAQETVNSAQTWKQTFGYDRYGNRTAYDKWLGTTAQNLSTVEEPTIDNTTNRISSSGYTFDANGNLIVDADGRQFIFNGDNKQTQVKDAQNNVIGTYYFDGEGKRIKKVVGNDTTVFVYSGGKLIAEYSTETPPSSPTTSWTVTDQLGSPRVIVNSLGAVVSRRDFMAFGEELDADETYRKIDYKYGQNDSVRQKFTGYQKDEETGLDFAEARMYQNLHGRFTAIDPLLASGKSADPQTFNRYVYVLNCPLTLSDPNGLQAGRQQYGKNTTAPTKTIDVFITISLQQRNDNEAKRDWHALAKSAPGNVMVNVYTIDDRTATVDQFSASLGSEGRTVIVYGHSIAPEKSIEKSRQTGSRLQGEGLDFSNGQIQGDWVVPTDGRNSEPLGKVNADNVLLFTCDSGSTPREIRSRMDSDGQVMQNGGGPNGASSVKFQEEAAYAATSALINGKTMKDAQKAAQNAINRSTIPNEDKGDEIWLY